MTPTPKELDRLEQQAHVRLQWIKDKREGRSVVVECQQVDTLDWREIKNPNWDMEYDYRLVYPEAKKREPVKGEPILVSALGLQWIAGIFDHFHDGVIYTKDLRYNVFSDWKFWKFPDEPEQVKVKEVKIEAQDWQGTWWIAHNSWIICHKKLLVVMVDLTMIRAADRDFTYECLMNEGWLRSQDGVMWLPCSREVEA